MVMLTPRRIAFGRTSMDPDRSYIEGLYISDGWSQKTAFCISGQDGCPKEEQKRQVQAICERLGIHTKWYRKYLYVGDREWVLRMHLMGHRGPEKHALSIDLDEGAAGPLLRGIMADSGANTHGNGRTFTTTSRLLLLQTRILHKMFGLSCSERFVPDHGGLGTHPVWRLGVRDARRDDKQEKLLRIKVIERSVAVEPVWDLETADHYVYLPEADVTVSNCDDVSSFLLALMLAVGCECRAATVAFQHMFHNGVRQFSHVFAQAKEPKSGAWVTCDPVAGKNTDSMIRRAVAAKFWPVA